MEVMLYYLAVVKSFHLLVFYSEIKNTEYYVSINCAKFTLSLAEPFIRN